VQRISSDGDLSHADIRYHSLKDSAMTNPGINWIQWIFYRYHEN